MNKYIKIVILLPFLYYLFYDINIGGVAYNLNLFVTEKFFIAVLIVALVDLVFSYRWVRLSQEHIQLYQSYEALSFSGVMNTLLPGKLGEILKLIYLKIQYGKNISRSSALLLLERFIDGVVFGLMILYVLYNARVMQIELPSWGGAIFLAILLSLMVFILLLYNGLLSKYLRGIPSAAIHKYIIELEVAINESVSLHKLIIALITTFVAWGLMYVVYYLFLSMYAEIDAFDVLLIFVVTNIAWIIPITPGGIGVYNAVFVFILGFYGIDKEVSLSLSIIIQIIHLIPVFIVVVYLVMFKIEISNYFIDIKKYIRKSEI